MPNQAFVNSAGTGTHDYTVLPHIDAAIDTFSRRASIFGGLNMDTQGRERLVKTTDVGGGGKSKDVASTSCVYVKEITVGDEVRFNVSDDFKGLPTYGNHPVQDGEFPTFYHDNVMVNQMDSPGFPFWPEMDQQRFANLITNMEPFYQKKIAHYMAEWTDIHGIEALLCGADRGQLIDSRGGLGRTLGNATAAGEFISCKNTFCGGHGMVAWNATRATFEAAIGTEIYDLDDNTLRGFSITSHEQILDQITSVLRFKEQEAFGMTLRAVALADPWLVKRLLTRSTNNPLYTLFRDADTRGPANRAINREAAVILDKVLYIPCDWLRAFRASGADGVKPTYGAALTSDPLATIETVSAASKKCCIIYMGMGALLRGQTVKLYGAGTNQKKGGKIWFTPDYGKYGKGGGTAAHTKGGFTRNEPATKVGGTVEYINKQTLVAWFYDPGPGKSYAA